MSINILEGLFYKMPVSHIPQDDAESFAWVKLWRYLVEAKKYKAITDREDVLFSTLGSPFSTTAIGAKAMYALPSRRHKPAASLLLSTHIQELISLIRGMPAQAEGAAVSDTYAQRYRYVYEQYFNFSFEFRKQNEELLRRPWAEFFNGELYMPLPDSLFVCAKRTVR